MMNVIIDLLESDYGLCNCEWPEFYVNKDMFCSVLACNFLSTKV